MDLRIKSKNEETLLPRTIIKAEVSYDKAVPSNKEIKSKLAAQLSAKEDLIVIRKIVPEFGTKKADLTAFLYKDEKALNKTELKHIIKKSGLLKEEKKEGAEAPKEA